MKCLKMVANKYGWSRVTRAWLSDALRPKEFAKYSNL